MVHLLVDPQQAFNYLFSESDRCAWGPSDQSDAVFTISASVPVELSTFAASVQQSNTELQWQTATEINNYGFEVERRSTSPVSPPYQGGDNRGGWLKVGFVAGAGTSNSPHEYAFSDQKLPAGRYAYRLKQIDNDGLFKYSNSVEVEIKNVPSVFSLEQNYPNPFNPSTTIRFGLPNVGTQYIVSLNVYDILGRKVATLVDGIKEAGFVEVVWKANVASGLYIYRIEAISTDNPNSRFVNAKKLLFLK